MSLRNLSSRRRRRAGSFQETYFWSTLVLGLSFLALLIIFLYKMFFSPRQVIVSLEKASNRILVPDPVSQDAPAQPFQKTRNSSTRTRPNGSSDAHNWTRHATLSLAVLSTVLGFMLGWEFENNIYAQEWVSQNIEEVSLIAFALILGVVLLPLAIIIVIGFLRRERKS